ncbi:MAG: ferritin-like protein [Sphingomonadales bacterium]|nr:ferritin-like protein [Sphingomonadales bacterium]
MINMCIAPETILESKFSDFHSRRGFLRVAAGLAGATLLPGCGGGGGGTTEAATPPPLAPVTPVNTAPVGGNSLSAEAVKLNLALNLEYLGAQFYAYASKGAGLSSDLVTGIGQQGAVAGGRQVAFVDDAVRERASELAADKLANVISLRAQLGTSVAAQPAFDFSASATSPFSTVAQAAGVVAQGATFDAFSSDEKFLIGAFLLENGVAATYRMISSEVVTPASLEAVTANLADAIYHGGLVRTMLATRAVDNAAIALSITSICAYLAKLDGSNVGDQSLEHAAGGSTNIIDADGTPIPFVRDQNQILQALYLTPVPAIAGGFLPNGMNGLNL